MVEILYLDFGDQLVCTRYTVNKAPLKADCHTEYPLPRNTDIVAEP